METIFWIINWLKGRKSRENWVPVYHWTIVGGAQTPNQQGQPFQKNTELAPWLLSIRTTPCHFLSEIFGLVLSCTQWVPKTSLLDEYVFAITILRAQHHLPWSSDPKYVEDLKNRNYFHLYWVYRVFSHSLLLMPRILLPNVVTVEDALEAN